MEVNAYIQRYLKGVIVLVVTCKISPGLGAENNVTGYVGKDRRDYGIYSQQFDWFQADTQCKEDGYTGLEPFTQINSELNLIMHTLRDNDFPQNSIFWTGIFRPFSYLTQWYSGDDLSCQEHTTEEVDADLASDHRCVTITLENLHDEITLAGDNCSNSFSYICSKHKGAVSYIYHYSFEVSSIPVYATTESYSDISPGPCEQICTQTGQCVGYTHITSTNMCTTLKLSGGYGYMTYTIEPALEHTTHAFKTRLKPNVFPNATVPAPPLTNNTLPSCNISAIPAGYCRCNISTLNSTEVSTTVEELIQNLTVNKDTTSKSRRKLTSAEDERPSAIAVGALGVIVLSTIAIMLFVFDFNVLIQQAVTCSGMVRHLLRCSDTKPVKVE